MNIELKKIEISERLSEETTAFYADLYINGKKVGYASNRGHGEPIDYGTYDSKDADLIKKAEEWCKMLPPIVVDPEDKNSIAINMDLEIYIDQLVEAHRRKLFQKKMERYFKQHIVISDNPDKSFKSIKFSHPIENMLKNAKGLTVLVSFLAKEKNNLSDGEKFQNTNIPEEVYKEAGLEKHQYAVQPEVKLNKKVNQGPKLGR